MTCNTIQNIIRSNRPNLWENLYGWSVLKSSHNFLLTSQNAMFHQSLMRIKPKLHIHCRDYSQNGYRYLYFWHRIYGMQFISYYMGFSMSSLKIICINADKNSTVHAGNMGIPPCAKKRWCFTKGKKWFKICNCKTITKERLLGSLMWSGCLQEVPTIGLWLWVLLDRKPLTGGWWLHIEFQLMLCVCHFP